MSTDIQFVALVNEFQLLRIEEIADAIPRTLRIVGRGGFNTAQRVLINDYGLDTFTRVSDTVLLVNPPSLFDAVTVGQMKVSVVSGSYTGGRARLLFGPTKNVRKVTGLQKLVQQIVKTLLSNVGSNKFSRSDGGGLVQSLGDGMSASGKSKVSALVATAVSSTESQVIAAQTGATGLTASERLLSLSLEGVEFNSAAQEVNATIKLLSYAGKSVSFPLTL